MDQGGGDAVVVDLSAGLPDLREGDPHWWQDPRNVERASASIANALAQADSAHAGTFERNAARYRQRLERLDTAIARCMQSVPRAQRKLVTDHDAFSYFASRYGIEVVGAVIPARTSQAQPSARDVARLVDLIDREHVRAVFPEQALSDRLARSIARDTGASADFTLYADALGPSGSAADTFLKMLGRQRRLDRSRLQRRFPTMPAADRVTTSELVVADGLAAGYDGRVAIEDVRLSIASGQRVGVLGPNGGGKTTLFRVLTGELAPMRGSVSVAGRCGVVPQTERSRLDYPVSALDVALMGTLGRLPWWRRPGRAEREQALEALDDVGLAAAAGAPLRRALRRPAPAGAGGARAGSGRAAAAARRALHRRRRAQRGEAVGADRRARARRQVRDDRHPRPAPGERVGAGAVPQSQAGGLRASRADPHARRCSRPPTAARW